MNKACSALIQSLRAQVQVQELIQSIATDQKPNEFKSSNVISIYNSID